jgi:uncharacterized membrane protein YkvA (DUF1232 family)
MDGAILMPCSDSTAQNRLDASVESAVELRGETAAAVSMTSLPAPGRTVNAMDISDLLTLLLMLLGVLALLGMAVIGFVMWRYRIPPRGLIAMIGALVYVASPIDVLPEAMLGPLGLLDDAGAVTAAAVFVYKLVTVKRRLQDAGVKGPAEARSAGVTAVFRIPLGALRSG